eukprot:12131354-Heterocapsa_arctica.AAC.1
MECLHAVDEGARVRWGEVVGCDPWDGGSGSPVDGDAGLESRRSRGGRPPQRFCVTFSGCYGDDAPIPGAVPGVQGNRLKGCGVNDGAVRSAADVGLEEHRPGVVWAVSLGDGDEPPERDGDRGVVGFSTQFPGCPGCLGRRSGG